MIQDPTVFYPRPSESGGTITFKFDKAVYVSDMRLMNIQDRDDDGQTMKFIFEGAGKKRYGFLGLGPNSVQRLTIKKKNVKKLVVDLSGPGAITELRFCSESSLLIK